MGKYTDVVFCLQWYEFPDDPSVWAREDAVMLGPAILVHPVLHQGADGVDVSLPKGVWYDFDTGGETRRSQALEVSYVLP